MDYALLKRIIEFNIEDKAGGNILAMSRKGLYAVLFFLV